MHRRKKRSRFHSRVMTGVVCLFVLLAPMTLFAQAVQSVQQDAPGSAEESVVEQKTEEAREREKSAEEDPLAQRQADRVDRTMEWSEKPDRLKLYGSIRLRSRWTGDETFGGDDGSRVGANGQVQYAPFHWAFARIEAGVNVLGARDILFNQGASAPRSKSGEDLFLRLGYVGIETPDVIISAGKNWSTYYQVAGFTDRFDGTGGSGTGVYNAGTDGGATGTGRADRVLQARVLIDEFEHLGVKPFKLNVQVQHGEPVPEVPGVRYGTAIGLSAVFATREDLSIGLAYDRAFISDGDLPALQPFGIDGDAQATVLGARWFGDKWYLATTIARLRNHETTDKDIYFDGWGWEVYGHYNAYRRWWATGGWNILRPDRKEEQAGDFEVRYGVIGVRYSFKEFRRMLYANVRFDAGTETNGDGIDNVYTIGLQWDLP